MRDFQLYGLGHALVDIFVNLTDAEFNALGFERGSSRLVDAAEQKGLLDRFHVKEPRLVSGGSVANSVIAFSQLGGRAAFLGCVGDDRYGLFYTSEFESLGIDMGNPIITRETTGTCACLITPDAERTMRTCLAVNSHLSARHVDEARLKNSDWLFVEGYMFASPDSGQHAIRAAVAVAKKHGVKVAITCSEPFVVTVFGNAFIEALAQADLLFCNSSEAQAVTGETSAAQAFTTLANRVPSAVVTDGANGVYVRHGGIEAHRPAYPCRPVDLTGAGDMLAGAFLYGITHDVPPDRAAQAACYLAMKVITQVGARLHHGTRQFWEEALEGKK
jgi:sugar/nucleoside kinase (ribokinase family)